MEFKDKITNIINEELYNKLLSDLDERNIKTYFYHFIVVKYKDHNDISTIKIDNIKDLDNIKDKEILSKYYVEKLHYYNRFDNDLYAEGMPCHIYNLGYFLVDGDVNSINIELNKLFDEYDKNYSNIKFEFNDIEFLSLNK